MPGRRLNRNEKRLEAFWETPPANFDRPLLRQIRIDGGPGLRGVRNLLVPIPYPLTVICGKNGVGKSTVLALAALSARPPAQWRVYWGNTRPRTRPDARAHYTFSDFFYRSADAPSIDGLRLGWVSMHRGNEIELVEEYARRRWVPVVDAARHVANVREEREIDFIPMSRVLSGNELGALRTAFDKIENIESVVLTEESLTQLSYIMGRAYDHANIGIVRGLGLATCRSGVDYNGFDMGGGESSLIVILSRLQAIPRGGLLIIEEVELGLHAEAQVRLMKILIDACQEKKIQIICTTHSEAVIDSVPRIARVLMRQNGDGHQVLTGVSTRFAIHEMTGQAQPELAIYTEDKFASLLIEEALAGPLRSRIKTCYVGSNRSVARQAIAHLRLNPQIGALSVFDGDCTEAQVETWLREERAERDIHPDYLILPGNNLPPEAWAVEQLAIPDYRDALSQELNCTAGVADEHIRAMRVQLDEHDIGFTLGQRTGIDGENASRMIARAVGRRHPGLEPLRKRISVFLGAN